MQARALVRKERHRYLNRMAKEDISEKDALREIPPLIKGYLRLGGKIGDGAVIDHAYNTTDVSIMVETDLVADKYSDRYKPTE